ncbi:MAG: hypothetical protein MHM6MM_002236 [Cercozoa sp. M6MM]
MQFDHVLAQFCHECNDWVQIPLRRATEFADSGYEKTPVHVDLSGIALAKDTRLLHLLRAFRKCADSVSLASLVLRNAACDLPHTLELANNEASVLEQCRVLRFGGCHISSDGVKHLTRLLRKNKQLRLLDLSDCHLDSAGLVELARALSQRTWCTQLTVLRLGSTLAECFDEASRIRVTQWLRHTRPPQIRWWHRAPAETLFPNQFDARSLSILRKLLSLSRRRMAMIDVLGSCKDDTAREVALSLRAGFLCLSPPAPVVEPTGQEQDEHMARTKLRFISKALSRHLSNVIPYGISTGCCHMLAADMSSFECLLKQCGTSFATELQTGDAVPAPSLPDMLDISQWMYQPVFFLHDGAPQQQVLANGQPLTPQPAPVDPLPESDIARHMTATLSGNVQRAPATGRVKKPVKRAPKRTLVSNPTSKQTKAAKRTRQASLDMFASAKAQARPRKKASKASARKK